MINSIKLFLQDNKIVLVLFLIMLSIISFTGKGNTIEITLLFIAHCIADIFVINMNNNYSKNNIKEALKNQTYSYIIFLFIAFYVGFYYNEWNYMLPNVLFLIPILKGYFPKLTNKIFNIYTNIFIAIILFSIYYIIGHITNYGILIQIIGLLLFPIGLSINNHKIKYFISLIGIFLITTGSLLLLIKGFTLGNVIGTDISYFLLSFMVFVFYISTIKKYI